MKNFIFVMAVALQLLTFNLLYAPLDPGEQKKAVKVKSVTGVMPNDYWVVGTEIFKDVSSEEDAKPTITRGVLGSVGQKKTNVLVDQVLTIPKKEIELSTPIVDNIARIAGAVNPKAGVVASSAAVIINEGLNIAGDELTKFYGNDPFRIIMLEVLPSKYYRINKGAKEGLGAIEVTPEFKIGLKTYADVMAKLVPLSKEYNRVRRQYQKLYSEWIAKDRLKQDKVQAKKIMDYYQNSVKPVLTKLLVQQEKLKNLAMHRIAIMATRDKSGQSCGNWDGPWKLNVFFYIGAKLTNIFTVKYCGKAKEIQNFIINLLKNSEDPQGNFEPGGIQLVATEPQSITFPSQEGAEVDTSNKKSQKLSWYDELIVDEEGASSVENYLFPFDLMKIEDAYKAKLQEKRDEKTQKSFDALEEAIKNFKGNTSKVLASDEGDVDLDEAEDEADATEEKDAIAKADESADEAETDAAKKDTEKAKEEVNAEEQEGKELTSKQKEAKEFLNKIKDAPAHEVLGVPANATDDQVRTAYKKMSLQWHPDKNLEIKDLSTEIFKQIANARDAMLRV